MTTLERSFRSSATLLRHQAGAFAATALDFGVMITAVRLLGVYPTRATAIGALSGAVLNFALARAWIFDTHRGSMHAQALRYALVAMGSLLLNVAGEHLAFTILGLNYVVARLMVSLGVSILWNFPLHRSFVFDARP